MVNPLEIMPVLAMAVLIVFIPILSDGPCADKPRKVGARL
jgi:hypothetical protein